MTLVEAALARVELLLALGALAGGLKSVYNGWVRRKILDPLSKIDTIEDDQRQIMESQDEIKLQQERHTDAIVALGQSHRNGAEFDVETFRREVRGDDSGPDDFLQTERVGPHRAARDDTEPQDDD